MPGAPDTGGDAALVNVSIACLSRRRQRTYLQPAWPRFRTPATGPSTDDARHGGVRYGVAPEVRGRLSPVGRQTRLHEIRQGKELVEQTFGRPCAGLRPRWF